MTTTKLLVITEFFENESLSESATFYQIKFTSFLIDPFGNGYNDFLLA